MASSQRNWCWKWSPTITDEPSSHSNNSHAVNFPPSLNFSPWTKKAPIIVCTLAILLFDLVMPCCIYYTIMSLTDLNIQVNLGIACASLGIGEMLELPLRGYRLVAQREKFAPLGQDARWGFDFLFWWYVIATVIGIVPYVLATSLDEPILWLFLMTPGFIVGFAVLTAAVSVVPFRLPVRISSDERGKRCKPFVYYVVEDFVAVDAGQMWGYRERLKMRWEASPVFRRLMFVVNLWWILGGVVFIGVLASLTWGLSFDIAYGLSLGWLFLWIGLWALATWWWVERQLLVELDWFAKERAKREFEKEMDHV